MARKYPIKKYRNIGIIAHIDAGKTTTTERILFYSGKTHKIGQIDDGTTVTDWMEQEREKGITITSAAVTNFWLPKDLKEKGESEYKINIIDTPGHIDFTAEVQRSLRVLDGGVVVFDAVAGVEPQSETVWRQANEYGVPRICFINKMDKIGANFEMSLKSIWDKLDPNAVAVQLPIGASDTFEGAIDLLEMKELRFEGASGNKVQESEIAEERLAKAKEWREKLIEKIVAEDEKLLEKYLEGEEIPIEELRRVLRKATIESKLIPVFCGTALRNKGIQPLLDAVVYYLPHPLDIPPVVGTAEDSDEKIERKCDDDEPFASLVFKVATDPYVGTLNFFRVYSGTLKKGSYVYNANSGEKERISRILRMTGNKREDLDEVYAGDIAATIGLNNTSTGHTLCNEDEPVILEEIEFSKPVISVRVEPKEKIDEERMNAGLKKLSAEDPTFTIKTDKDTGETIISGMGELHLEILIDRLKREFKVEANVGRPQVAYKETIKQTAEAESEYARQSGGRGQYGHVFLRVEPKERGEGFEFINEIKGGDIPREFIPAVEKGVIEAMGKGVLAGYPLVDMTVTLYDGSYHEVDSSEFAFKIVGSMGLQKAARKANLVLLEPIMKLDIVVPSDYFGDIIGDLSSRRGQVKKTEDRNNLKVIHGEAPLAEMFGYATTIRSLTKGRGTFTMEFDHYEEAPQSVTQEVIEGKKK
jgi:elongation factor G